MTQELLEKRQCLFDMAEVLYGEDWLISKKFWESSIQRDLFEVTSQLEDIGYDFGITEEEKERLKKIWNDLLGEEWDEDEDESWM